VPPSPEHWLHCADARDGNSISAISMMNATKPVFLPIMGHVPFDDAIESSAWARPSAQVGHDVLGARR
jgi:hypothetical protein